MTAAAYLALLHLHRAMVGLSVLLFVARGLGVMGGAAWPMQPRWRRVSVLIDTVLLAAGVALWVSLSHHPAREPWLATKLALLPVYVVLGSFALKRGRTPAVRLTSFVAALAVVAVMIASALTRSAPWQWGLSP